MLFRTRPSCRSVSELPEFIPRADGIDNHDVEGIDTDSAYMNPKRITAVVSYILEHFLTKDERRTAGYRNVG